jgi:hypothetical protein
MRRNLVSEISRSKLYTISLSTALLYSSPHILTLQTYGTQKSILALTSERSFQMNEDTKIVVIGFAVLGLLAAACLIIIGITTVRFIRSEEATSEPLAGDPRDDAGRKAGRVSNAALSSI